MQFTSVQTIQLTSFNSASITGTYQVLNGTGTSNEVKILRVINSSTQPVTISYDGINDSDVILAGESQSFEFQANASNTPEASGTLVVRKGQTIYGKGTAGTGTIYIGGYR